MYAIALTHFMQTQVWPIAELQRMDRETDGRSRWAMEQSTPKDPLSYSPSPEFRGERLKVIRNRV